MVTRSANTKKTPSRVSFLCWRYLSFRFVSKQVLSAELSLTDLSRDGKAIPNSSKILQKTQKENTLSGVFFVLALPIFPVRLQSSIVGRIELN